MYSIYISIVSEHLLLQKTALTSSPSLSFRAFFFPPSRTYLCLGVFVFLFSRKGKKRKRKTAGRCLSSLFSGRATSESSRLSARACVSFVSTLGVRGRGWGGGAWVREQVIVWCVEGLEREVQGSSDTAPVSHPPSFVVHPSVFFFLSPFVRFLLHLWSVAAKLRERTTESLWPPHCESFSRTVTTTTTVATAAFAVTLPLRHDLGGNRPHCLALAPLCPLLAVVPW